MRRTPRDLDREAIKKFIENKTVLITGAAGSIGSEIVRQCLQFSPKQILALDQSEYGLYILQEELRDLKKIDYILGDTTQKGRLEKVFSERRPEIVFHAAAY
jgi:UDP-N-acetyl-D-glucosamine 4,6-dehydratase